MRTLRTADTNITSHIVSVTAIYYHQCSSCLTGLSLSLSRPIHSYFVQIVCVHAPCSLYDKVQQRGTVIRPTIILLTNFILFFCFHFGFVCVCADDATSSVDRTGGHMNELSNKAIPVYAMRFAVE